MGDSSENAKGSGAYGMDPHGEEPPAAPARPPRAAPRGDEEPSPIKALDICPNCGSPMGPIDTVVCLRCGFDFKTLKVIKTTTAPEAKSLAEKSEPAAEAEAEAEPLCGPGAVDLWLPALLGAMSLVLLAIGCLAGASGLMGGAEEPASFLLRLDALLRVVLRTAFLAASGLGGLYVLAQVVQARMGDLKLAAVRMVGIMAVLGLPAFISMKSSGFEWTIESIIQGFGFVGLTMFFFGLKLRDALTLLGVTVFAVLALLLGSMLVQWAAPPV